MITELSDVRTVKDSTRRRRPTSQECQGMDVGEGSYTHSLWPLGQLQKTGLKQFQIFVVPTIVFPSFGVRHVGGI